MEISAAADAPGASPVYQYCLRLRLRLHLRLLRIRAVHLRGGGRGWKGRLRFVESRHEEQWSTQYLAAWRTKARQKPEGHRGQHELSVEEQYEEGQPLFGRLLNKTRSHLWFADVLLSLVNKSNMLFESRDLAKECVAQRFTRRCLLSFVRRHTSKVQRP